MSDFDGLIGRTIVAVEEDDEYGYSAVSVDLVLDNGERYRIGGTGYDCEGVYIEAISPERAANEARERAEREAQREWRRANPEHYAPLTHSQYLMNEAIRGMALSMVGDMNRQFYGGK